jgi:hypothetical protein
MTATSPRNLQLVNSAITGAGGGASLALIGGVTLGIIGAAVGLVALPLLTATLHPQKKVKVSRKVAAGAQGSTRSVNEGDGRSRVAATTNDRR